MEHARTARTGAGRPPRGPRRHSAFTLIELLVVIAIIALLLSLLTPALGKAKDLAREVTCRTNLHNIGQAMYMYTNEQEGKLPWQWWYQPTGYYPQYHVEMSDELGLPEGFDVYQEYIHYESPYVLLCPSVTGVLDLDWDGYRQCGSGYAYGANYVTMSGSPDWNKPSLLPWNRPQIELVDNVDATFAFNEANHYFPRPTPQEQYQKRNRFRHRDHQSMNVCYFDGHAGPVAKDWMFGDADWCTDWWPDHPFWAARGEY